MEIAEAAASLLAQSLSDVNGAALEAARSVKPGDAEIL